jgi:hypothetical protein
MSAYPFPRAGSSWVGPQPRSVARDEYDAYWAAHAYALHYWSPSPLDEAARRLETPQPAREREHEYRGAHPSGAPGWSPATLQHGQGEVFRRPSGTDSDSATAEDEDEDETESDEHNRLVFSEELAGMFARSAIRRRERQLAPTKRPGPDGIKPTQMISASAACARRYGTGSRSVREHEAWLYVMADRVIHADKPRRWPVCT